MATRGKNEVTLTFAGDSSQLEKTFGRVGSAAKTMDTDVKGASRSTADSFDRVGEAADTVDTRAMGFRDTITGLQDTFRGATDSSASFGERLLLLGMGVGDLASGMFNFLVPAIKNSAAAQKVFNLVMAANPIGLTIVAFGLLVAAVVLAYKKFEGFRQVVGVVVRAVIGFFQGMLNSWLSAVESMLRAAATFVRIFKPKWADAMDRAADSVKGFREKANRELDKVKKKTYTKHEMQTKAATEAIKKLKARIRDIPSRWTTEVRVKSFISQEFSQANRRGDGPGAGGVGQAIARARAIGAGLPVSLTSGYRTPAHNAAIGGSPTSFHMDRANPAGDWSGPWWAMNELYRRLVNAGGFRELIWQAPGHYDHVHAAKTGGIRSGWTLVGEEGPEFARLPVGTRVIPNAASRRMVGGDTRVVLEFRSGGSRLDDLLVEVLRRAADRKGLRIQVS